ncbi:bis(5'-nucleosyl)-tetraphosphatase PrpE [Fictibacillus phosphorivorans]|uniref:bis(5'-nucleosyl)-tetraphosphatase PrpE n=1 Tax=Fictibacillus phosphorivorans TaxID=1221500 RepID=UPI00204126C4|nr:bis(5'-nucleosyl)-tetraphosphatase PrpE [Fictibacillus phosphorivorans]MCM3719134.1 bis(5'-nucleosyl)-tetraphosphatase PrpE [Fictibacillus phosphorivorans]MCM3776756.1 bis(5'-nucleosyl)-tetraphosphatase PrpE [Fictibacillus phosphorivorans]
MKYDIIGDIHGCFKEYQELTEALGYSWTDGLPKQQDRKLVFLGDLTDRGPESIKVMEHVCDLVEQKQALYTPGNHCNKLYRYLIGRNVQVKHGLETTVAELKELDEARRKKVSDRFCTLYENAPLYLELDFGNLVVAHAGIRADYIGQTNKKVKTFVLYGDITGETNPDGTPVRRDWAKEHHGDLTIVYGHTPVEDVRHIKNTWNIDTGCVFGGKLSALRYPEMKVVSVPSTMPFVPEKFRSFDD